MSLVAARRMDGIERTLIRQINDAAPPGSINLGLGQPDLPTPPRIAVAGVQGIAAGRTAYTSTAGDIALRAAVAARYAPFAMGPENVLISVGSQEAVFATMLTLVDPGDEVLYPDPGYPAYPVVARLLGAVPVPYPLSAERQFRLDPDTIAGLLTAKSRLVIVCSPSNPTGAIDRDSDLERLAHLLRARGVAWLSDEIYAGFAYDGPVPSLRAHSSEGIVVSGLSKDLSMTGWRIGWAVGPASIVARIIASHQYVVTCASSVSQAAAIAAVGGAESERERASYLEIFRKRRALMAEELSRIPGIRFHLPGGAFYFFVDISRFGESLPLCRRILENRSVITIPGVAFGPRGEGFVRISFAASESDIREGMRRIAEELKSL